ncbi:MAG: PadR family transcriptional regulator [Peptococcaceae bacterium]|jgi:DNA-binding PadR family transcriptional regulator|nr:PadR family transcriptional regulator [Peptococcaceae bacterium]
MRKLKYAILGLINRKPMTGYDLTIEFDKELASFWYAKHSQIYPELKKLTDENLITFETVIQGEKLEKKVYTITEKGKQELKNWILRDEPLEPTPKDVFRLRAYFIELMNKEEIIQQFTAQLEKRQKKLAVLQSAMENLLETKDISNIISEEFGDYIVLKGAIMREQAYIDWLNECLAAVKASSYKTPSPGL